MHRCFLGAAMHVYKAFLCMLDKVWLAEPIKSVRHISFRQQHALLCSVCFFEPCSTVSCETREPGWAGRSSPFLSRRIDSALLLLLLLLNMFTDWSCHLPVLPRISYLPSLSMTRGFFLRCAAPCLYWLLPMPILVSSSTVLTPRRTQASGRGS